MAGLGAGSCQSFTISFVKPNLTFLGIWVLGFSGLQIALQIVIADVTTLRWRPIVSTLSTGGWYLCVNFLFFITFIR